MAKKPRMGSDPFQKKDPLGWIGGGQGEATGKQEGVQGPPSLPSKPDKQSTQSGPSKTGKQSKQDLPSPPSSSDHPSTPARSPRGSTTSKGLRPGWTRATFIVREETLQQLKAVAYWDRKELKRVVEEAFGQYLRDKEVPSIPEDAQ